MADVASSFKNWSKSAASNQPTSSTVIGSGLAPNLQQIQATLRAELGSRSSPLTAASTVDLNSVDEGTVLVSHVSGTVSISSFGTVQAGIKKLVTFSISSGTLTLVYNATSMIIPSAANIVIEDGDSLLAESLGSGNWKVHFYFRADGSPLNFSVLNGTNDPTFSSTSDEDATSPEWVLGYLEKIQYTSSQQSMTAGGLITVAHGLGSEPKNVILKLICTTADGVYSVGDKFSISNGVVEGSSQSAGVTVRQDATNVYVRVGSGGLLLMNNSGSVYNITLSNYRMIVIAEL